MNNRDEPASAATDTAVTPIGAGAGTLQLMGVERIESGAGAGAGGVAVDAITGGDKLPDVAFNGGTSANTTVRLDEPPRKRLKLLAADATDASALRKRILEHKLLRLKNLRDRFTEQLSELYFLQAGGNMMDYSAWRKKPAEPRLVAFIEARRPPVVVVPPPPAPLPVPAAAPSPSPLHSTPTLAPQDEMVEKAKQEAYVASRVSELSRAGLWTDRRLPRVCEPPRDKTHWDYLLEEMTWLAQDFAHERKWKKQAAKKCARAVQKFFQDKALAAQKAEKAQELHLKKIAAFAAKEIRTFWANVEKLVEWKRVRRVERARKEALDEQLSYIVDRTERYSRQLAANLAQPPSAPRTPSAHHSDDEFEPRGASDDDEETIAAAEQEAAHDAADHRDEIEALQRESHLALDDLLPPGYLTQPRHDDYAGDEDSADDENTIAEQERSERAEDTAAEVDALRDEAHLDIEELRRRYAAVPPLADANPESDTDSDVESATATEADTDASDTDTSVSSSASERLEALVEGSSVEKSNVPECSDDGEQRVEAAASLAATLQPTGTTLSETAVGTAVPRLLRHSLREYQHVGLHWLATMHARGLNGILADEMGLGKTIQTIALLGHLALDHRDWGPHLVVAPTSVVLNWEMEFKKWCPAFKILTYYGTIKERKLKRVGWTKANSFHVCITSYKLVVQDHQSFRRKRWKYLILDEAQNIKNFKSQRWQMLLNFQTERRLLLTGTPLQNSLLELWSLMHFLMPDVFASHSEFREWFNPVASLAEGAGARDAGPLVRRLHEVLRPFLLRRLKADVERQMPSKYDHVLLCRLSKRQRFLYDDFMSRAKTKESLASGNLLSVINVLMQLRKVCNHPDLFEPRPVSSPLQLPGLRYPVPALALSCGCAARIAFAARLGGDLSTLEAEDAGAFEAHRARHLAPPRRLVEEIGVASEPPRPPPAALRLHLRLVPRTPSLPCAPPLPPLAPRTLPAVHGAVRSGGGGVGGGACTSTGAAGRLERRRRSCLRRLAAVNERRCWRLPLYGADLRSAVSALPPPLPQPVAPPALEQLIDRMNGTIDRFGVCWMSARAGSAEMVCAGGGGGRGWRRRALAAERALSVPLRAMLQLLHAPAARQAVAFPHPRLLQYDCGKLQTLDALLRRLRAGGHRVLIFTQMTRVLDVLEAFLSLHGHTYLRLDGATRVDRRQPLVDRFNADKRVFAFILSTRSGGVGLNLTGADSVVFYDSDWNPTMDAQAQDRCHRIGQTRDVHVYRLVTAGTVEENILRKAEQKRALGHLAIEDGHFTTSYLRGASIKELFGEEAECASAGGVAHPTAESGSLTLESALAAAEDEADAAAARAARAEHHLDLAEFDETLPLPQDEDAPTPAANNANANTTTTAAAEVSDTADIADPAATELAALMKQLTPIEKYAMRLVESSEAATEAERTALDDMQRQLREWERARRALRDEDAPAPPSPPSPAHVDTDTELTYSRDDAAVQTWVCNIGPEQMPMWCPPTPPSSEGDVYCESWSRALYRRGAAPEALLPPVTRRESRALRAPHSPRRARHVPRPAAALAPPSLFERAATSTTGAPHIRQRPRPRVRAPAQHRDQPQPEWTPPEDSALRRALRLQRLPADAPPALAPNWEWVAELVHEAARAYRSPRSCRDRHDALADPERARRKQKKLPAARRRGDEDAPRPPLHRLDAMRDAAERRRTAPKRRTDDAHHNNPKHAALLAEHGVDYEVPPSPMEVASRRAERIAKEKQKAGAGGGGVGGVVASAAGGGANAVVNASVGTSGAPPPRIVVAAHPVQAEAVRRVRSEAAGSGASSSSAPAQLTQPQLLYRQQAQGLTARHHLKILHHATATSHSQGSPSHNAAVAANALQLQQLAVQRRAAAPAHSAAGGVTGGARLLTTRHAHAHSHVVVAHLAPAPAPPPTAPTSDRNTDTHQ